MLVTFPNDVKIYNLSAGKSLPEVGLFEIIVNIKNINEIYIICFKWLSDRKKRKLLQNDVGK